MQYNNIIENLLKNSCASIKYRIKRDILNQSINTDEMKKIQSEILNENQIKNIFSIQKDNGWIGDNFHGENGPESIIRYFIEKGIEPDNPVIKKLLNSVIEIGIQTNDKALNFGVGDKLDLNHLGGTQMVKACVFAYANATDYDFVQLQIQEALYGFKFILDIHNLTQIYKLHKNNFNIFNDGMILPTIYHLRLLAYTHEWRNEENINMLIKSLNKLISFVPIPDINLYYKNQRISPAKINFVNLFSNDILTFKASEWMLWFHWVELISKLGITNKIPAIQLQLNQLQNYLNNNDGYFIKNLSHYYFTKWTAYTGLSLDYDWNNKSNKINNLTFRSLLILISHQNN